jgi:hypothetical protein
MCRRICSSPAYARCIWIRADAVGLMWMVRVSPPMQDGLFRFNSCGRARAVISYLRSTYCTEQVR